MIFKFLDAATNTATTPMDNGAAQPFSLIIMLVLMGLVFYFFVLRPQKKQEKEITKMRNSIMIGDEISTNGGLIGRVVAIKEDILTIEVNKDRTKMNIFRWAVRAVEVPVPRPEETASETKTEEKKEKDEKKD